MAQTFERGAYWHFSQQTSFASLHLAPGTKWHVLSQQASDFAEPTSHCSSFSTSELPQKLPEGCLKQLLALLSSTAPIDLRLHGEKILLFASRPDTEYVYMMYLPPLEAEGEHSGESGSCSLPQL
jgi:hypothetical protein